MDGQLAALGLSARRQSLTLSFQRANDWAAGRDLDLLPVDASRRTHASKVLISSPLRSMDIDAGVSACSTSGRAGFVLRSLYLTCLALQARCEAIRDWQVA